MTVGHQIINITNFTVPLNRDICNISDIGQFYFNKDDNIHKSEVQQLEAYRGTQGEGADSFKILSFLTINKFWEFIIVRVDFYCEGYPSLIF